MRYQFFGQGLWSNTWSDFQPETFSSVARGFGCFSAESTEIAGGELRPICDNHRIWEIAIDLDEIGAEPGNNVWLGMRVESLNPTFTDDIPSDFVNDFSNLVEIRLATQVTPIVPDPDSSVSFEGKNDIEVTQAVQTRDNSLPLVAQKDTVARMYVDSTGGRVGATQPSKVYLYGSVESPFGTISDTDLPGSPLTILHNTPLVINRSVTGDTANFQLPRTWIDGDVKFHGIVKDYNGNQDTSPEFTLTFTPRNTPLYWIIPVNSSAPGTAPNTPTNAFIQKQMDYLEKVFPVPDVDFVITDPDNCEGCSFQEIIDRINSSYFLLILISVFFSEEASQVSQYH